MGTKYIAIGICDICKEEPFGSNCLIRCDRCNQEVCEECRRYICENDYERRDYKKINGVYCIDCFKKVGLPHKWGGHEAGKPFVKHKFCCICNREIEWLKSETCDKCGKFICKYHLIGIYRGGWLPYGYDHLYTKKAEICKKCWDKGNLKIINGGMKNENRI